MTITTTKKTNWPYLWSLLVLLLVTGTANTYGQVGNYMFTASAGTFTPLVGGTSSGLSATADDAMSGDLTIGFPFIFNGTSYTQFRVSSNGALVFGTAGTQNYINNLASATTTERPGLAPLWDDLQCTVGVTYQLSGVAPNQVLTVEWLNVWWRYPAAAPVISFQVKLYQTTNRIDFVYRQEAALVSAGTASIGLMGTLSTDFLSLQDVTASPALSTVTSQNSIATKPATGQVYTFIPCGVNITGISASPASICAGASSTLSVTATGATSYTWNPGGLSGATVSVSPATTTSYTVTATDGVCPKTSVVTVTVKPLPVITASGSPATICAGASSSLSSTPTPAAPSAIILSESFTSGLGAFTATNASVGGTPALAAWTNRPNGYAYGGTWNSNDNSSFVLSNSDAQGLGSTTNTTLVSPAFSTIGKTAGSVSFYHYFYEPTAGSSTAKVEASTDGLTWTTLQTYNSTQGTVAAFANPSVALTAPFLNQPTVYVRFNFSGAWRYYWGIDNVTISATPATYSYAWVSSPAGFTSAAKDPGAVSPAVTTTYSVTVTDPFTTCTASASTTVTVNPSPVLGTTSATPNSICLGNATNLSYVGPCGGIQTGFAGSYAPANWTLSTTGNSNGTINAGGAPANIVMTSSNGAAGGGSGSTNWTITIPCSGNVTFNWAYTTVDGPNYDYPRYSINGGAQTLFTGYSTGGAASQSGSQTIAVNAGDILQLNIYSADNGFGSCTATITNFTGPTGAVQTVNWYNAAAGGTNLGTGSPLSVTPATPGAVTYYAEISNVSCTNPTRVPITINVNALPTVTSTPVTQTVCQNAMATVSGGGAASYTWSGGITNNTPFTVVAPTTYTVTGTDANGCTNTATAQVLMNTAPAVTATPVTQSVCTNSMATVSGGGAISYTWTGGITNATPFAVVASNVYTVTGTDGNGCTNTATAQVLMNSLPLLGTTAASPNAVCLGNATDLSYVAPICGGVQAGFAGPYAPANWTLSTTGNSNGTINTGGAPGNIVMTSSNLAAGGGAGSTNWTITIPCSGNVTFNWAYTTVDGSNWDYPRYSINGGAQTFFTGYSVGGGTPQSGSQTIAVNAGDILQLNIYSVDNSSGSCTATITNFNAPTAAPAQTVNWYNAAAAGTNLGTGSPLNVTPATPGTVTYYAEISDALCTNTTRIATTVNVNALPSVTANPVTQTVCENGMATISGGGAATYTWTGGIIDATPFMVMAASNYTVTGTDANGCTNTATAEVLMNTIPVVTASPITQTVCENGTATISGGGAASYTWTGGIMDATPFMVMAPATYTVTGTDANGCTNTATAEVLMNAAPVVSASATPTTTCNMTSVTPNATGANSYVWTGGLTNGVPFVAMGTATYTVTGTDGIGCTATSTVTVTVNPASGTLAPATSNQSQTHDDDFNINYYDGACDLIATVDDGTGGNILGLTTSTVNVDATAGFHNGQPFVRRWYQITPTSNGSADVILYINQSDFDDYNAVVVAPYLPLPTSGNNADPNVANIRITKNDDAGLGNNPIVIWPTVNWNGTYWELSFNTPSFSQFRVHSVNPGGVPLPATVTNFSGMKLESSDKLSWTTASEQNNAYFNLQHSTDGVNFSTIAKVNSKSPNGNSTATLNYSSVNNKPALGHNYYRLQQVDIDQKVSVHAQIVDLIWGANGSSVSIYPNPTTDILNVDLYTAKAANTTVKLLDMSGRVVKQIQAKSVIGMNNIQLSMGEIASGLYTIQVYENNTLTHTSKVRKND